MRELGRRPLWQRAILLEGPVVLTLQQSYQIHTGGTCVTGRRPVS